MKVFIMAAQTADGFIGKDANHLANWSSKEDKRLFMRLTKEAGVAVFGSKTYDTFNRPLPGRRTVVYTRNPKKYEGVAIETTQETPTELVKRLEQEGVHGVAVCGGTQVYDMFLRSGVVEELWITVEPILFGQGITLFNGAELEHRLQLLDLEKLNQHTYVAHYKVEN